MQRKTVQRQIIADALKNFDIHPTVDEVYAEIQKNHPSISKTTVYRNLRMLAQDGKIRQVVLSDDAERYDKRTEQHYHFKCYNCGRLFDVDMDYLEDIDDRVRQEYDFQIHMHDVIFRGFCLHCRDKNEEK